ncbi:citrate-binding protein-like [Pyrus x bretschneideri]|uniref:citrate-binding protein-like n=1 Tax=Pyrus x bretschneideri TaxID=225117 RepID=UPI00202F6921|nr:citrate-binding protein-like [Pyrus x bretschneideri]
MIVTVTRMGFEVFGSTIMTSPSKLTTELRAAHIGIYISLPLPTIFSQCYVTNISTSCRTWGFCCRGMTILLEFGNLKNIYVPSDNSGVTIVQIHGAAEGATSLQLRMYDGDIKYYKYNLVAIDPYDKWFQVNIIHNVDKGKIIVFIDGVKKFEVEGQGPGDLYFTCGVYATPENSSNYMESRWKEINFTKNDGN